MVKILDYYFLTLSRLYCYKLDYRATWIMVLTFMLNIFSLIVLFNFHILDQVAFWIGNFVFWIVIYFILEKIYTKKRRERIKEKYKEENDDYQDRVVAMVIWYEVLSVAFLIFAIWLAAK